MIDVYKDELTMRVNDQQVTFKFSKAMSFSNEGLEEVSLRFSDYMIKQQQNLEFEHFDNMDKVQELVEGIRGTIFKTWSKKVLVA
jgi:hypothetical protein